MQTVVIKIPWLSRFCPDLSRSVQVCPEAANANPHSQDLISSRKHQDPSIRRPEMQHTCDQITFESLISAHLGGGIVLPSLEPEWRRRINFLGQGGTGRRDRDQTKRTPPLEVAGSIFAQKMPPKKRF
eukprot:9195587-Pyramimonas_sp.AAC.1